MTLLTILAWLLSSYIVAYRLTHRSGTPFPEPVPALAWGKPESLRLTTSDGEELGAWFIEKEPTRPVVLILHGNGSARSGCLSEAELVAGQGCGVMLVTLRAHGDSTGTYNDIGYSARNDVEAAVEWLSAHHPGRPVVVWGQSLGAAAALFAAPKLGDRVHGYILECPYQDLRTAVRNRTRLQLPPVLDYIAYRGLSTVAPLAIPNVDDISPLRAAESFPENARVLILCGCEDRMATPDESRAIAAVLGSRAESIEFEGAGHLELCRTAPDKYRSTIVDFIGRCVR